jgi:hypothetical protein
MVSTSRASRNKVEDAEIFQVLEEGTGSDVTIFSSEEDEDGNEPDSDEDGQFLGKMASYLFQQIFSSTDLMKMLLEQETYSCGTTRANRKNWPTEFTKPNALKLKRGESRKLYVLKLS